MHENESHLEANLARLIKTAIGGEARLREAERKKTWSHLVSESRRNHLLAPFPDRALVALGGLLVLATLWLGVRVLTNRIDVILELPGLFLVIPVAVNLACIPAATMTLFRRSRGYVQTG